MSLPPEHDGSPLKGGPLNAALANLIVRLFSDFTGRGPTQARTLRSGNMIAVFSQDMMTKAERNLAAAGEPDLVVNLRRQFQRTMSTDLISGVESLTAAQGRVVHERPRRGQRLLRRGLRPGRAPSTTTSRANRRVPGATRADFPPWGGGVE